MATTIAATSRPARYSGSRPRASCARCSTNCTISAMWRKSSAARPRTKSISLPPAAYRGRESHFPVEQTFLHARIGAHHLGIRREGVARNDLLHGFMDKIDATAELRVRPCGRAAARRLRLVDAQRREG